MIWIMAPRSGAIDRVGVRDGPTAPADRACITENAADPHQRPSGCEVSIRATVACLNAVRRSGGPAFVRKAGRPAPWIPALFRARATMQSACSMAARSPPLDSDARDQESAHSNRSNASRFEDGKLPKLLRIKCHAQSLARSRATALIWIMGWSARQRPSRTSGEVPPATPWTAVTAERLALTLENASSTAIASFSAVRLSKSGRPQSERLRP